MNIVSWISNELVQLDSTKLGQLYEYVLQQMASNSTYTGTLTVGNTNPIGVFTDTARQNAVGSNVLTIVSNTYPVSQITNVTLSAVAEPPTYIGLDTSASPNIVITANLTSIAQLANNIVSYKTTYLTSGYYLSNTAPGDGGTWQAVGQIVDTLQNFTINNQTYFLWRKLSSGAAANFRPLKTSGSELIEYNNAEMLGIIKKVEEYISNTRIGTYVLQATAPVSGTWANRGTITDIRRKEEPSTTNVLYDTIYTLTYDSSEYTGEVLKDTTYTAGLLNSYTGSEFYTQDSYLGFTSYTLDIIYTNFASFTGALTYYTGPSTYYTGGGYYAAERIDEGNNPDTPGIPKFSGPPITYIPSGPAYTGNYTAGLFFFSSSRGGRYTYGPFIFFAVFQNATAVPTWYSFKTYYTAEYTSLGYFSTPATYGGQETYTTSTYFTGTTVYDAAAYFVGPVTNYTGLDEAVFYESGAPPTYYTLSALYEGFYTGLDTSYGSALYTIDYTNSVTQNVVSSNTEVITSLTLFERLSAATIPIVDFLIVGGGGGGGSAPVWQNNSNGGGGGGGGYRDFSNVTLSSGTTYSIVVGNGGAGAGGTTQDPGQNGSDSSAFGYTAAGGGGGGSYTPFDGITNGSDGGSGGGGGGAGGGQSRVGGSGNVPAVSPSQGNSGGNNHANDSTGASGGGGGAGAAGSAGAPNTGGNGGIGKQWLDGNYYAGGGGGAGQTSGSGGTGGGAAGNRTPGSGNKPNGSANTGGGGGGRGAGAGEGGDGGSGIVAIRQNINQDLASYTGNVTTSTSGSYRYYYFTGSGTITF